MQAKPATSEYIAWFKHAVGVLVPKAKGIIKSGEVHVPAMFVYPNDPDIAVAIIPVGMYFEDDVHGKDIVAFLHQKVSEDEQVKCVIMLVESWVLSGTKAELRPVDWSKGIEEHPDKKEALVFNGISEGMQLIATFNIERPGNTIPDTPTALFDPKVGIIEGEGAGEGVSYTHGRMILEPDPDKPDMH